MREYSRRERAELKESLIITAAIAPSPLYPEAKNASSSVEATIETASACCGAGASIIHLDDSALWTVNDWSHVIGEIRRRCDAILQADFSHRSKDEQNALYAMKPDMVTAPLTHYFVLHSNIEINALHTSSQILEVLRSCDEFGVKPELEIWHSGSIWRLNDLIGKSLLKQPYFLTLYFGWPGGNWSPPTVEELLYRFRLLPEGCICSISVAGIQQTTLSGLALGLGSHLRVGTRDNPYLQEGVLARDNAQLVEHAARLGSASGRRTASPEEARKIIGVPPR